MIDYYENGAPKAAEQQQGDIDAIRGIYVFQDQDVITEFLRDHGALPKLLLEAFPHLQRHFGSRTVFTLRAPMDEDGSRNLYGVAMWPGSASDAMDAIDKFEDDWWIGISRQACGYLNFTYELE